MGNSQDSNEPVAWRYKKQDGGWFVSDNEPQYVEQWNDIEEIQPLFTAPPKRTPLTEPLSAAIESILHTDDLSEEIHQAQINSLRAAYDAAKSKRGGRNESA